MKVARHIIEARREAIAKLLSKVGYVPVLEICKQFNVSEATARREWEPRYRAYVEWVNELFRVSSGLPDGQGLGTFDFEERLCTIAICGTPAQAVDRIRSISEVLSLDTFLLMFDMGGMPLPDVLRTIQLVGAEVLPHL